MGLEEEIGEILGFALVEGVLYLFFRLSHVDCNYLYRL